MLFAGGDQATEKDCVLTVLVTTVLVTALRATRRLVEEPDK